ncbi:MAG: hypothetical protein ACPGTP_07880 [Bacteroidia bacterium]
MSKPKVYNYLVVHSDGSAEYIYCDDATATGYATMANTVACFKLHNQCGELIEQYDYSQDMWYEMEELQCL